MFTPPSLTKTLGKVTEFENDLKAGIALNDKEVEKLTAQLDDIEASIRTIESQTEVATKLLSKLQ